MQKGKELEIELAELLYMCFWVLMLFTKGIGLYDGQTLYKIFLVISMGFLAVKMCITKHTLKEWVVILTVGALAGIVFLISREKGIVICTMTILAMKNVSVKRVLKVGMWAWGITMLGNIAYHLINIDASGYKVHEKLGLGHIFRWDLGFSHPNVLHISYLVLCGFIIYNIGEKYNWKHMLALMTGNIFIFIYSVSYTGILVTILYLGMMWYVSVRKELCKLEYFLMELIFPGCILLSFLAPILLPDKIFNIVNKIFSNRLMLAEYYLIPENIKLFGNNLERMTTSMLTMDNAYVFSFIIYGVLVFGVIVVSYLMLIHRFIKQKKNKELVMIVCFLVAGITEPFLFNTSFKNIALVFMGSLIFDDNSRAKARALFNNVDYTVKYNYEKLYEFGIKCVESWKKYKKKIMVVGGIIGILLSIVYGATVNMPQAYIMPRVHVDIISEETWHIEDVEDSVYDGMKILDYVDSETNMQIISGNIVTVELLRGCLSVFVLSAGAVMCILMLKYIKNSCSVRREIL